MSSLPCACASPSSAEKRIGLVGQHFQVIGSPGLEAHLRQSRGILRRFDQVLLLDSELSILAISNQRIRDVAETRPESSAGKSAPSARAALRQGERSILSLPPFKDRLRQRCSQVPESGRAGEKIRERRTLVAGSSGKRDLRKVRCPGHADLRVGGNQVCFCLANVGPPLQQRRRKSGRNLGRMRLLGQLQPARNVARIIAQKNADGIFLLRNLALKVGDFGRGGVDQLLRLPHVEQRVDAVLLQSLRQLERVAA